MLHKTLAFSCCLLVASTAWSQVVLVPNSPQIGSGNPVTAEPPVPRPAGTPCKVSLFSELEFANFTNKTFKYAPPAHCRGPWAKVVFTADFTVTAGNQFDRTAAFYLGNANLYYGTTAEPGATFSPSWHVERDVTDLTALFEVAQTGEADLGNFVGTSGGVLYNGLIYANAALEFYPLEHGTPKPDTPDLVIPLPDAAGGAATLDTTASLLMQTVQLPRNTERVLLDVIAQSQSGDEFWYTCVPNDVAAELESCGNTGFRETEIAIDGKAAGVAPVYPWIYTGGIDPFLWQPIVGIQTLDFKPYRVNLTPFAGLLADGRTHTVSIGVYNADSYFLATANLLVYVDPHAERVTGAVERNTLAAAPSPVVKENLKTDASGNLSGSVTVSSARSFVVEGYVDTSHGRVETTVETELGFENRQTFSITASNYVQDITQSTTVTTDTTVDDGRARHTLRAWTSYPLVLNYAYITNANGSAKQTTQAEQHYLLTTQSADDPAGEPLARIDSKVESTDTLNFDVNGNFTGNTAQSSSARYREKDLEERCDGRSLEAVAGLLTSVVNDVGCHWGDPAAD